MFFHDFWPPGCNHKRSILLNKAWQPSPSKIRQAQTTSRCIRRGGLTYQLLTVNVSKRAEVGSKTPRKSDIILSLIINGKLMCKMYVHIDLCDNNYYLMKNRVPTLLLDTSRYWEKLFDISNVNVRLSLLLKCRDYNLLICKSLFPSQRLKSPDVLSSVICGNYWKSRTYVLWHT